MTDNIGFLEWNKGLYVAAKEMLDFKNKPELELDFYTEHYSAGETFSMASKYGLEGDL